MGKSGSKIQSGELLITYQVEKYMRYLKRVANAPRRATRQMFRNANRAIEGAAELTSSLNESLPEMRQAAQNVIHIAESAQLTLEGISATTSAATDALSKANEVSGAIQDAIPDVRVAAQKVVEIAETAKTTLDGLGNATKTANEILLQMQTALAPVKLVWRTTDLTPTLLKIGAVLVNLKFAGAGCKFASLFFNIAREFGSEVVTVIKNYLFNRETMNEGEVARRAKRQGLNLDDLSVFAQVQNWMANHMTVTVTGLSVALFAMFQCTLGLPVRNMNTQAMLKFFGERSRHLKSMVDFVRGSWNIFTDVAEWIIEQVFPGMIKHELDNYIIGYTEWSKEVISLVDPKNPVNERVKKDKKLVFRISALYKRGLKYSANLSTLKINDDLRDHFQKCFRLCEGFLREADHSGALGNQPRVKPYIIQLFGESGVGKSGMLWPLCSDLNAALCKTEEEAKDIASEVYFRNAEQEFWDAYAGQNICVWDDFGQLTETSANPNPEFFEIIRAGNSAPYPLHMATLEEKAKTKFISKFCILTSNKINQKVSSLTFPSAMRRRIDCLCSVEIKPEFAMSGTNLDTGETVTRLDPSKCAGVANTDVYVFTLHDPETQQPLYDGDTEKTRKMNYEELVEFILKQSSLNFGASIDFNNSITERMNSERFNKMRSLLSCKATRQAIQESEFDGLDRYFEKLEEDQMALVCDLKAKPIQLGWLKDWKRKAQEWFSLKSVLITIGAILSGFGVLGAYTLWNKSKQEESDDTLPMPIPEGFSSGDNKTKYTKVLRAEASVSSDNITKYAKKIRAEGIDPDVSMSKTISRLLRHQMISEDGWIEVEELLRILKDKGLTRSKLINICQSDEIGNGGKGRFQMDKKNDKIRATQGHSFPIDPRKMYEPYTGQFASHFTYSTRVEMIADEGLKKMNRAFVHLHPGHISTPPVPLPNRSDVVWVDLTGLQAWLTPNGYVLVEFVPRENIVSFGKIGKLEREASVSGDNRTKYLPHVRTECDSEATLQAWKDKSAQELITHRVLGNLYRISIDGQERLNGLFVRDTCMLTVEHLSPWLRKGKEITISNMYGSTFTVPIRDLKCVPIKDSLGNSKDAMLIQFPRHVNCHSDIIKHFQKEPELSSRRADVCVPCIRSLNESRLFTILGNASCKIEHARVIFEDDVEVMIRDSLQYNLNTTNGDCGSPVIVNDTSFIRKIAGIHIAAYDDGSSAIGQSVTQNDILKHLHDLRPIVVDHDDLPNVGLKKACLQIRTEYSTDQIQELLDMPAETFGYIGQCEKIASPPAKTDLRPSKIYGYIEPTTKPAILRHPTVNMVHRNMEKCAINCPYIPQEEIDRAVGEVKALLISGESRTRLARVLTYEEAVAGSDISDYVDGIKRQSSPGYPHTFNKKPECPGKTTWFGKDEWVFSEEIRELVNTRIAWASEGKRYPTVWSDTLKDERRPIEKVNALKTRVFAHGPMDYTIAFRMYFLGFIAHIMENRIANEQSLGTNPFGMDWLLTSKKLSKFGKRVFAGDFSQFDGTLNACIMKEFAAVANTFYNDGPMNALIREVLMLEIYNSIHLCSGKFIQLTHSQPSGNPLTTVLNSFYNSVSMRIAYYRCFAGKAPPFLDNVSMVSYGDDNVINFSEKVEKEFNQNTVTEAYASFGMIYTDETKTMGEMAPWRLLSEVNYLKRMFRLEDGVWRAPLALETILESCNWVRKCPDELEACVSNCETAFRELAQHPEPVFKKYVEIIANALYEQTGQYPVIQPRLVYLEDDSPCW